MINFTMFLVAMVLANAVFALVKMVSMEICANAPTQDVPTTAEVT